VDFVDAMRIRKFDLLAREAGCDAAWQVLGQRATAVRRVVLLGGASGARAGGAVTALSLAEASTPDFADRLVSLLAVPA
jgi:hypothetical protein